MIKLIMSTESLDKTSISENHISKKTPKKVNIDVLKKGDLEAIDFLTF